MIVVAKIPIEFWGYQNLDRGTAAYIARNSATRRATWVLGGLSINQALEGVQLNANDADSSARFQKFS